jgi:squalene synthase HpnC
MPQLSAVDELAGSPLGERGRPLSTAEAVDWCRRLTKSHYENFTVTSWLLPKRLAPHFYAIYAWCRTADDLADEQPDPQGNLARLDDWQRQLEACYDRGNAREGCLHPIYVALRPTIREFAIPPDPFVRLLTAFRQDQAVHSYATPDDLLAYCRNSANPVGELVLYLAGAHDDARVKLSDATCTGLQLANFCQDVARDWAMGRVYLPQSTLDRAAYREEMFARGEFNEAFRQALREEVDRADRYLVEGDALVELVGEDLRLDVALFGAGGRAILQAIRDADFNVWARRPTLSRSAKLGLVARQWWRTHRRSRTGAAR